MNCLSRVAPSLLLPAVLSIVAGCARERDEPRAATPVAAAGTRGPSSGVPDAGHANGMPDSGHAARLEGFGVLVPGREMADGEAGIVAASAHVVTSEEPSVPLDQLGFFHVAALTDSAARFSAIGGGGTASVLAVADPQRVGSALHQRDDACSIPISVSMRRTDGGGVPWRIGLAEGGGGPVAPGASMQFAEGEVSEPHASEVGRLIAEAGGGAADGESAPFTVASFMRGEADGMEIIVIDARRELPAAVTQDGTPPMRQVLEQRLIIAERDIAAPGALFRISYSAAGTDGTDWGVIATPVLVLRMGAARHLVLYSETRFNDGAGGAFIARTAPGRWARVAGWSSGC